MRKSDQQFTTPTRQSIFAIALIILKYIRIIVRQVWPLILLFIVGGSSSRKSLFLYIAIAIALISMIWAIIAYFKFYFYLKSDEIIIKKGVLRKTGLTIPFARVQAVNFKQNILHRVFNVTQLDIDTAGSKGNEFSFDALSHNDAQALREIILSHRGTKKPNDSIKEFSPEQRLEPILKLDVGDLIKVGISQNHIRSGVLIFAGLFWLLQSLDEVGFSTSEIIQETFQKGLQASLFLLLILFMFFLLISFLMSLIRTVINYYDLGLYRQDNRYKLVAGLFTKKETAIVDRKIQIMEWSDNLLQKMYSYYSLKLKQASSVEVATKNSIRIPGCNQHHIDFIMQNWLGKSIDPESHRVSVSIHFFYRRLLYRMISLVVIGAVSFYFGSWIIFTLSVFMVPYFIMTSWYAYKKAGFSLDNETIYVSRGMIGDKYAIMPLYKIQSIRIRQTPYQSRRNLANVDIFSASGYMSIPYISVTLAQHVHDYLSFKVLSSKQKWM